MPEREEVLIAIDLGEEREGLVDRKGEGLYGGVSDEWSREKGVPAEEKPIRERRIVKRRKKGWPRKKPHILIWRERRIQVKRKHPCPPRGERKGHGPVGGKEPGERSVFS